MTMVHHLIENPHDPVRIMVIETFGILGLGLRLGNPVGHGHCWKEYVGGAPWGTVPVVELDTFLLQVGHMTQPC